MKSDFTIIQHDFPKGEGIKLLGVYDLHLGAQECREHEWNEFCNKIVKEENTYLVLGGDLMNNATKMSVSNVYAETMRPREQKKRLVEMLAPLRDKILCATPGNHERRSAREVDEEPVYDIMCKLDLEDLYRENLAFLKLKFGDNRVGGDHNPSYMVVVTHGHGGGALTGGKVNKANRFMGIIDGADMLMIGHTHDPFETYPAKIKIDASHNQIKIVDSKVLSMSSWLNYGGYAARMLLTPTSNIVQEAYLSGNKKQIKIVVY